MFCDSTIFKAYDIRGISITDFRRQIGVRRPLRPGAWVKHCLSDRQNACRIECCRIQTCRHTRAAHLNDASRISAAHHSAPFTAKRFSGLERAVSIEILCGRTIDRTRHMPG